jgi:competence protein ComEC
MRLVGTVALVLAAGSLLQAAPTLDVYVIDTEGGKAVIVASPGGETMLIDAGYPTPDDRDTNRIVAAAETLKIRQFDSIVSTHYDADHAGNVPRVAARIPAKLFVDHGEALTTSNGRNTSQFYEPYLKAVAGHKRLIVKPGDTIPLKGVKVTVVSSHGEALARPLPGAGAANPAAADAKPEPIDVYDNAASIGILFEYGKFRMLDLADLLQAIELRLVSPSNLIGSVDLFMVGHHGFRVSNSSALLNAIQPKVFIMNNSTRKGGEPQVLDNIKASPRFQDLWQLHSSAAAADKNAPADFIANPDDPCQAKMIKVSARPDGTFTVTNTRNGFSKTYRP